MAAIESAKKLGTKIALYPSTMTARAYASTHIGQRKRNEDSYCVNDKSGLFVVADGVGGAAGGEVASDLVVKTMSGFFDRNGNEVPVPEAHDSDPLTAMMAEAIYDADRSIIKNRVGRLSHMGSTVAAILVREDTALVAHVGDSRVYHMRGNSLSCLTRDHNAANDVPSWAVGSEMSLNPSYSHQLTRAVGVPGFCNPEFRSVAVERGDRFLLCTDGLTGVLSDREIASMLRLHSPETAADTLVRSALRFGADDNTTVIVVEVP